MTEEMHIRLTVLLYPKKHTQISSCHKIVKRYASLECILFDFQMKMNDKKGYLLRKKHTTPHAHADLLQRIKAQ